MNTFIMKEITKQSGQGRLTVIRTRTSDGYASISIKVGKQSISINNGPVHEDTPQCYGDEYEQIATELAQLIDEVASNPCQLP